MNLCISPETRKRLITSAQELLYEQDTGIPCHHSTFLGSYEDNAEALVDSFIDDLNSFTPTLTY